MSEPALSVILLVGDRRERAPGCLASLLAQDLAQSMEMLVVDAGTSSAPPLALELPPNARLLRIAPTTTFGRVRAEAVRQARAPIVAFLEEHVRVLPGWAAATLRAHAGPWAGVGPEVHNGNPGLGVSDVVWRMNYWRWLPPAARGESALLAGHNASYKRAALLEFSERLDDLLQAEVLLQWALVGRGHKLLVEPQVKIAHINETTLGSITRGYYLWNRCFGAMRPGFCGWSAATTIIRLLLTPLVPWVRLARLAAALAALAARGAGHWTSIPGSLLPALVAESGSALGQAAGMLLGERDAGIRFLDYELNQYRAMPSAEEHGERHSPTPQAA